MTIPANPLPSGGLHQPPPGAGIMNAVRWVLLAGLLVLAIVSVASWMASRQARPGTTASGAREVWSCPMHPSYVSDHPGDCPICGMRLEKRGLLAPAAAPAGGVPGLAVVDITPERVQMIGVRTAIVERRSGAGRLELVGFVSPAEGSLRRVQLRVSGWIEKLYVDQTGSRVSVGQPLVTIYSPELFQSEQEFLIAIGDRDTMTGMVMHNDGAASAARQRLGLLGVPDDEIARLERERTASTRVTLRSPAGGTVLERGVSAGQYVSADTPLLTLADLSHVWVLADLYEMDLGRVKVGDVATFTADGLPGRSFAGRVEFASPTVSTTTRTLKLRITLADAGGVLRPGMYGRVVVEARGAAMLQVPGEAVVSTGEEDYVFLAHAGGRFEPRRVTVRRLEGERAEVLAGLAAGDTVVASASFLIDSESRLRAAIEGLGAAPGTHHHGDTP